MSNCLSIFRKQTTRPLPPGEKIERSARDARITSLALGMLALCLIALSYICFGVGTLPAEQISGLGSFPYLGGSLMSFVAIGLLCGSGGFALAALMKRPSSPDPQNF